MSLNSVLDYLSLKFCKIDLIMNDNTPVNLLK